MESSDKDKHTKSVFQDTPFNPADKSEREPDTHHYDGKSANSLDSNNRQANVKNPESKESWLDNGSGDNDGQSGGQSGMGTQLNVNEPGS